MKLLLLSLLSMALVACSSSVGNDTLRVQDPSSVSKMLVKNKTTKQSVVEQFGAPSMKAANELGQEIWGYRSAESTWGKNTKTLIIAFNKSDKVESFTYVEG